MRMEDTFERIGKCGVVAIVRGIGEETLAKTVEAIVKGGIDCIEIVMSVRGALRDLTVLKERWGDEAIIGAGEVLNGDMANLASAAQADFCSGIGANSEMIRASAERDVLPIPGALTPTEIQSAWHAGASVVKLFPIEMFDAQYIATMRRILYRVELMPSGGITPEAVGDMIRAGAHSVGAGRYIVDAEAIDSGNFAVISANARAMREAVDAAR